MLIRVAAYVDSKQRESPLVIFPLLVIISQLLVWLLSSWRFFVFA